MRIPIIITLMWVTVCVFAQDAIPNKKQAEAIRITEAVKIDGQLDDPVWTKAPVMTDFVQKDPVPGGVPSQKSEVKLLYDDAAIYIGAMLYDTAPDSIRKGLIPRDGFSPNTSHFGVFIDPYQSGINGVGFMVTASGVQLDARYSPNGEDMNWNAVWKSSVDINDEGWAVEMRIPYSALRFPKAEVQEWAINFQRRIRRNGEEAWWSELDPEVSGFFNQFAELKSIKNVDPPVRLFLFPYVSYNLSHYPYNDPEINNLNGVFNAGMDIKYGINDAFTLDMTLIPDFGQTVSDDQILNLDPFEVQFDENRQFFTEGTELFSKGDLFYSRRIGGQPVKYYDVIDEADATGETIVKNPNTTQLLNSSKISGRTKGGLGIGVFNSISARTKATLRNDEGLTREIITNPLTNYNVFVLDQNLKNNSSISLINTNVWRQGSDQDAYEANVTGALTRLANKKNSYEVEGGVAVSQKYFSGFDDVDLGYQTYFAAGKINGKVRARFTHEMVDDQYDHNDLGFLRRNNYSRFSSGVGYVQFEPKGRLLRWGANFNANYETLYKPWAYRRLAVNPNYWMLFKNRMSLNQWMFVTPFGADDYDDPRSTGRFYNMPSFMGSGLNFGTDDRKRFNLEVFCGGGRVNETDLKRFFYDVGLFPSWIISDKWQIDYGSTYRYGNNDTGWVTELDNGDIIFGRRNIDTYENVFNTSFIFTNKMALNLRARHYWSTAVYQSYFLLGEDGNPETTSYTGLGEGSEPENDINYNAFNIDLVYTWEFTPGSQLSIVWKNAIATADSDTDIGFIDNFSNTISNNQSNLLSVKILYFLDYLTLQRKQEKAIANGQTTSTRRKVSHSKDRGRQMNNYLKTVF